jgi:enoyl-[acyl-carrier protein] reductase I
MLMKGKTGLVVGVANKNSIAWAIAQRLAEQGAGLIFSYQSEKLGERVEKLVDDLEGDHMSLQCDLAHDTEIEALFDSIGGQADSLDFLVHSVAFAKRDDISGEFVDTSRDGFSLAQDVSAYSLVALSRAAAPLLESGGGGSILTLTYLGSERVIPNYNVMGVAKAALEASVRYLAADLGPRGIRVNAVRAGTISTLAARGIAGFGDMLRHVAEKAPLRRNTEPSEVGDAALFLLSDLGRGVTGETLHVDCGYHVVGM